MQRLGLGPGKVSFFNGIPENCEYNSRTYFDKDENKFMNMTIMTTFIM